MRRLFLTSPGTRSAGSQESSDEESGLHASMSPSRPSSRGVSASASSESATAGANDEEEEDEEEDSSDSDASSTDEDNDDFEDDEVELLGAPEDKEALREVIERFKRDDLAGAGDRPVAAIRMQVHMQTKGQMYLHTILSCGFWVLFKPREDQGVLLLTQKGRVIKYGKGQEAHPDVLWKYLEKVMALLVVVVACIWYGCVLLSYYSDVPASRWWTILSTCFLFLALLVTYLYAQRPRRDCGATFRQHFEVDRLNAATYIRVDQGRLLRNFCMRRRQGHLRLYFGRFYPRIEDFNSGLPECTPDMGGVSPAAELPHAMAGERQQIDRNKVELRTSDHGVTVRFTAFLAFLGIVGFYYDVSSFLVAAAQAQQICEVKKRGCRWKVDNQAWLGRHRSMDGVNPPWNGEQCKPSPFDSLEYEFCDHWYHRHDHCIASDDDLTLKFVLTCSRLKELKDGIKKDVSMDGNGNLKTRYVVFKDMALKSEPTALFKNGMTVMIEKDMILKSIGGENSAETKLLQAEEEVDFTGSKLRERCETAVYGGKMKVRLMKQAITEPLDDEDCHELQAACMAEAFGPKTNGWLPPSRLFGDYDRAICYHMPYKGLWDKRRWNVLSDWAWESTCHGEPIAQPPMAGLENMSSNEVIEACKKECEQNKECYYAFVGRPRSGYDVPVKFANLSKYVRDSIKEPQVCWLYRECPTVVTLNKLYKKDFVPTKCGAECNPRSRRCFALSKTYKYSATVAPTDAPCDRCSMKDCRKACLESSGQVVWCNGFAYSSQMTPFGMQHDCLIYGPEKMQPPAVDIDHWEEIDMHSQIGDSGMIGSKCFVRLWPPPDNRARAGRPGLLLHYTDKPSCGGCWTRSVTDFFFKTPSNFASVLTNLVTIIGLLYIARSAHTSIQVGKVVFSGKPLVDMTIVEDAANQEDFAAREEGYNRFVRCCFEVASESEKPVEVRGVLDQLAETGQAGTQDCAIDVVHHGSFDDYEVCNVSRNRCFVDRDLLGLLPSEKVIHAWSDTKRHGLQYAILYVLVSVTCTAFVCYFLPEGQARNICVSIAAVILGARFVYYYAELRREQQGLGVITSRGRVVQLSRRPPPIWFLPWRGGVSLRLDTFNVGDIYLAQLDMPTVPLAKDRFRAGGLRPAWRRGTVAVRCEHGILEISRRHGEVLEVYKAITALAGNETTPDLRSVGRGGAEVDGFCPSRHLLLPGERHIWEKKMDAYGFFGDPFNYISVLSITDRRIIVSRVRVPKPLSLIGICVGPLTFGGWCRTVQEMRGTHPYITVTCISHKGVESYVTTRTRAPPFWPGFMQPKTSISLAFLARFMQNYPAGLFVTQRPYGISLRVLLTGEVKLARRWGGLVIVASQDKAAPRGHIVESVKTAWGRKVSMRDARWSHPEGSVVGPGHVLRLEAADPEWNTYGDEPWLRQVRQVLDHVLGRSTAPEDAWLDLEEPEQPPEPGCGGKLLAGLCGAECFGHHFRQRRRQRQQAAGGGGGEGEDVEVASDGDDNPASPLMVKPS